MNKFTWIQKTFFFTLWIPNKYSDSKRKWAVRKEEVVSSSPNAYQTLVTEREGDQRRREKEEPDEEERVYQIFFLLSHNTNQIDNNSFFEKIKIFDFQFIHSS